MTTETLIVAGVIVLLVVVTFIGLLSRYRKCASDEILVVFGKAGKKKVVNEKTGKTEEVILPSKIIHGGGTFVMPVIQDWAKMSLKPIQIQVMVEGVSSQMIKVRIPVTLTTGIGTDQVLMQNAASRFLTAKTSEISDQIKDILIGEVRSLMATMTIEEINADRIKFIGKAKENIETELNKVGFSIININNADISDDANYIKNLGQKAATKALAQAQADIAEEKKKGDIQIAETNKQREIAVADAEKERETTVAQTKQEQEVKVAEINQEKAIRLAEAEKNKQAGIAEQKAEQEASIARANTQAESAKAEAESQRIANVAKSASEAASKKAAADAEAEANVAKAKAEADSKKADATKLQLEAEAEGTRKKLLAEAEGKRASLMAEADKVQAIEMAPALAVEKMIESGLTPQMVVQYKTVDQLAGIAQASAQMFEHIHLGQVTVYGNENTAGNFMAKTAENLNPALDLLRSIPFADTVKEMFGKKQVEATEFEEVK